MVDTRTPAQRRSIMQSVGTKHTGPEVKVRQLLHRMGLRFRLHRKDLPGRPDIVLPRSRTAILVHGCFWHSHGCAKGKPPKSRLDYWMPKLRRNRERDGEVVAALAELSWTALVIWQCELKDLEALEARLWSDLKLAPKKSIDSTSQGG